MPSSLFRNALVLGLLTAIGPFAIDMYLPALPEIARALGADTHAVQASLTIFFIALGGGQLISGPLSDAYGRKLPLYLGLVIFVVGSVGCALSHNIETLVAFRFVEGLGACFVMVIPRAIVRDLHAGAEAARLMSLLMTVYSVSPILAPLVGSILTAKFGWQAVFWTISAIAAFTMVLVGALLPETRPQMARTPGRLAVALRGYGTLLTDRNFIAFALMASLTLSGFFVYVANSSFVLTAHYGVSPQLYAILFALNAVSFVLISQANAWLAKRYGLRNMVRFAAIGHFAVVASLAVLLASGVDRLELVVGLLFVCFGLNGIIVPSTFVLAMEERPGLAGTASALIGTLNFVGGGIVVAIAAVFANGQPLPMVAGTGACSLIVFVLTQFALDRHRPVVARDAGRAAP